MNARPELAFQIQQFLLTSHKFDNIVNQAIRDYLVELTRDTSAFATLAVESRTRVDKFREKSDTSHLSWSQIWAVNKSKFRKVVVILKRKTNLSSSFSSRHFRQSSFAKTSAESIFFNLILKLSEILSSLNLADQLILIDRIVTENQRFRSFFSSFLTIAFFSFNFTFYQHSAAKVFDDSLSASRASIIQSVLSDSILDFVENSRFTSSVQFAKIITTDSKLSSFESFNRTTSSDSDKQTASITVEYDISRIFSVQKQSTAAEQQSSFSIINMTFNSRNAEFGAENIEQEDSNISSSNQQADDQITNQSAKSTKIISDVMFSHAQRMKIADIVTAVLRMNRQNNSFSDISFTSSSMITIFETRFERWNAVDLDFFDSAYEEKIIATAKSVQHVEKDTYFRDVHLFIDRIKNIVIVKDYDIVRNNLYTCFREQVMIWYISEMTDEEKELIKIESNLNVWERYLIKRFRERSNVAMITIIKERYIMKDARRRRESREYVDVIMRIARSAELESESH